MPDVLFYRGSRGKYKYIYNEASKQQNIVTLKRERKRV